eukprot:TRINITY_DN25088_c0_g1_i4.p7 TRINITY_DN25088_c0_g1~~TRINITY_DN25088_c0_g1_i4.p7  ORF type:complete len:103 (-),score=8.21 TRINITY_DN25088_c0_g1_i4:62-370(-)
MLSQKTILRLQVYSQVVERTPRHTHSGGLFLHGKMIVVKLLTWVYRKDSRLRARAHAKILHRQKCDCRDIFLFHAVQHLTDSAKIESRVGVLQCDLKRLKHV